MKRSVLICDDAKIMRAMMRKLLEESGYFEIVGEAGDGFAAIQQYEKLKPSLVVLDLNMPIRDGATVAKEILQKDPQAKFMVVTTKSLKRKAESLQELGVLHISYKPLDAYEFVRTAMKACGLG
ncbi:MAG: response regulator [Candidatus Riflebacteria bacterium]|nr:response regulator [Candidatus Riflebacteria bacterium]